MTASVSRSIVGRSRQVYSAAPSSSSQMAWVSTSSASASPTLRISWKTTLSGRMPSRSPSSAQSFSAWTEVGCALSVFVTKKCMLGSGSSPSAGGSFSSSSTLDA